ncbi:MAG TPA: A/G-specific adenine glycosylase [Arenimonas sp.]|nr:A/G-specific adenine glycosylase [Arenimonas sp.]
MPAPGSSLAERLLAWFDTHGRHDLPWQHPRTPYRVWLAEIMLQQTQVQTVLPYYTRFLDALPDLPSLAAAEHDTVMALWAGLGYYARARNLHRAAKLCVEQHGGELPSDIEALSALPGIGRSTAGAILAQAHGQRHAILDGNVKRLLCRLHSIEGWPGTTTVQKRLWQLSESHLPSARLADYTQAIMDFGATLCRRSNPDCDRCPLQSDCIAFHQGRSAELPQPRPGKPLPQRHTWMLLLHDNAGRILLQQRPPSGIWAGLWSLPEAADHIDARHSLARHAEADFDSFETLPTIEHTFSHFKLQIEPLRWYGCRPRAAVGDNDGTRWFDRDALQCVGLPAPIRRLLQSAVDP